MRRKWNEEVVIRVKALAEGGATTRSIAEELGLSNDVAYEIVKGLDIEAPWKTRRRLRQEREAEDKKRRALEKLLPKPEHLEIVRRYEQGETLQEIGDSIDLSRERVRQIINATGSSPKLLRRKRASTDFNTEPRTGANERTVDSEM